MFLTLVSAVVVSAYFAVLAGASARAARQAEHDAKQAETNAENESKLARKAEADAIWQARLANAARHAIQIDLALRASLDNGVRIWDADRTSRIMILRFVVLSYSTPDPLCLSAESDDHSLHC